MMEQAGEETKRCPFCGEAILAIAVKCKHCNSILNASYPPPPPVVMSPPPPTSDGTGIVLALIPWIGVALCWFWVGESPLLTASSNLTTLGAIIVIGTAITAAIDASALQFGVKGGRAADGFGPVGTFIGVALLWIVFYPIHMTSRTRAGAPNRTAIAVVGALAFVGSLILVAMMIDDKIDAIRRSIDR